MYSLARDLHIPVGVMLKQMTQDELCHWIAFHKIENEKYDKKGEKKAKANSSPEDEQTARDAALIAMLKARYGEGKEHP